MARKSAPTGNWLKERDEQRSIEVQETYPLDASKLDKIVLRISGHEELGMWIREEGIGINGPLIDGNRSGDIARLVHIETLEKPGDTTLYLQTLGYKESKKAGAEVKVGKVKIVDLVREYIV